MLNEYSVRDIQGYDYPLLITDVVSLDGQGFSWKSPPTKMILKNRRNGHSRLK